MYTRRYTDKIKLAVLDTAGTFCDGPQDLRHRWPEDDLRGCKAPVVPFYEVFKNRGITVDWAAVRKPMGHYKPVHLRMLFELPEVTEQFRALNGRDWTQKDVDEYFEDFKPIMSKVIVDEDLAKPIDGAIDCIKRLREAEIIVGCDTGYLANDSQALNKVLEDKYGMKFDVTTNSEIVQGRPSPFMVYDCMSKADVWNIQSVVKIDDTAPGVFCGNNAGCWTIGLYATGSNDYDKLAAAKPDFLLPSVDYVADCIFHEIEPRLRRGERPGQGIIEVI